jgi:phospholipase/carboxylesterase
MTLESISLPPSNGKKPEYLLVLLHGWGANYQDLAPIAPMFNLPNYQFMFPNAPFPHPQMPGGKAWYALEQNSYEGIAESCQLLHNWLLSLSENTGVPLEKTVVAGFSQGGAMSLDVGLKLPVAGVCSLSGYLQSEPQKQNHPFPPVLICHGKLDPVVPLALARKAKEKLESMGVQVQYQEFDTDHSIVPAEIMLMGQFLVDLFD